MMVGALVLLLAAIVIIFFPGMSKQSETSQLQVPVPTASVLAPIFPPPVAAVVPLPVHVPAVAMAASAPALLPSALQVLPVTNPLLRLEAKGVVWVEVKDSKGVLLIQRTLQPKEVASVSGQPPLAVVVGRINEIASVNVRGKPFSLNGMSPDNVARFEVK
jgi:cytoskeleton protein RodZ